MIPGLMPPLGNRLVAPAAGGADATLLTAAQLTALGITTTRTGSQLSFPGRTALTAAGFAEVAANAPIFTPVQIGSEYFTALLPQAAAAGLVTYSNRLDDAAWTKTNCTAEWVADAGLAFGGYTLVTATGATATVTRALTRGSTNRRSLMLADVPAGNVGTVKLSQDDGTVQVTMAAGFGETETAQATAADPTLHLELSNSGDTVKVYDWAHQEPANLIPVHRWFRPVAAAAESVGTTSYRRSITGAISAIDFTILAQKESRGFKYFLYLRDTGGFINEINVNRQNASLIRVSHEVDNVTHSIDLTANDGGMYLIDLQVDGSVFRGRINGGSWVTGTAKTMATVENWFLDIGVLNSNALWTHEPIAAIRDNNGQLLGSVNAGFNLSAITAFEATL